MGKCGNSLKNSLQGGCIDGAVSTTPSKMKFQMFAASVSHFHHKTKQKL